MANKTIGHLPYSICKRLSNPTDKNSEKKYFVTAQARETITLPLLAEHMAEHGSPFTEGTISGVLTDAVKHIVEFLRQGYSVRLDGLCQLRYSFQSDAADTVEECVASNVVRKVSINAYVDEKAERALNTNVEYEFAMTREAQAQARKQAKSRLATGDQDYDKTASGGSGDGGDGGGDGGDGEVTE